MRTEWLNYFLDIAKSGSLHLSAEKFYISQPALGKAIASLERELGYPLFNRTSSGIVGLSNICYTLCRKLFRVSLGDFQPSGLIGKLLYFLL